MGDVIDLPGMPAAAGLYARALSPRPRPEPDAGLPDRVVRLAGHRCTVAEVASYDATCGFRLTDDLPATWLHVLTFPLQLTLMTAVDFPLPLAGLVHAGNTMTQLRPVSVSESIDLSVRAEDLRPHRRGVLVDLVGEAWAGGERVWCGRSQYLSRRAVPSGDVDGGSPAAADSYGGVGARADGLLTRPDGRVTTAGLWRMPAEAGRRYAAVSGDVNPIHLNPLAARAFGFPRAIAHGMWTHARVLAALQPRLGRAFEVSVEFSKPVLLPSTVRFSAARTPTGYAAALTDRSGDRYYLRLMTTAA